jgi:protein-histidine pros-kinase
MDSDLAPQILRFAAEEGPVVVVDNNGQIVYMNPAAEKLFEVALEDIVGEFVEMLVPEKMRWGHQAYRRGYLAEPNDREMDPGLDPHLQRVSDEVLIPISGRLEPVWVEGTLFVAAHLAVRGE